MVDSPNPEDLKQSPAHDRHVELGAKFAEFSGWSMPLEYEGQGVLAEHTGVRERVGVFDVSHLGTLRVTGPGAVALCDAVFTNDLGSMGPGKARYTLLCTEDGGVIDDLIAYVYSPDDVLLIPNAANAARVAEVLAEDAPAGVTIQNVHEDVAIFAVQGPRSPEVMRRLGLPADLGYMAFEDVPAAEALAAVGITAAQQDDDGEINPHITVCRTGYTGERGYEILVDRAYAPDLLDAILRAGEPEGIVACGLGARDTLRTEMGYALHGHELSESITPWMARLGWAVGWGKESFHGQDALIRQRDEHEGIPWLMGIELTDRGVPRAEMRVFAPAQPADHAAARSAEAGGSGADAEMRDVGVVTSGTFSPTLKKGIALALLDPSVTPGDAVFIEARGRMLAGTVRETPFVQPSVR